MLPETIGFCAMHFLAFETRSRKQGEHFCTLRTFRSCFSRSLKNYLPRHNCKLTASLRKKNRSVFDCNNKKNLLNLRKVTLLQTRDIHNETDEKTKNKANTYYLTHVYNRTNRRAMNYQLCWNKCER